jgi:hypothetical protein
MPTPPDSLPDDASAAAVVIAKYADHLPLYRQAQDLADMQEFCRKAGIKNPASIEIVKVNTPRQSRGLYDVSRSKRLKTPLAWLLTSEGPAVASGNTRVFVTS